MTRLSTENQREDARSQFLSENEGNGLVRGASVASPARKSCIAARRTSSEPSDETIDLRSRENACQVKKKWIDIVFRHVGFERHFVLCDTPCNNVGEQSE